MKDAIIDNNEINKLVEAVKRLNLQSIPLSPSYFYSNLPFCLIDACFSINVRYESVVRTVNHFREKQGWPSAYRPINSAHPPKKQQQTISDLISAYKKLGNAPSYSLFDNKSVINPKSVEPTRKADLIFQAALIFHRKSIETFQDLNDPQKTKGLEEEFNKLPGLSSGLVWNYFLMLAGNENYVKADRMIISFLKATLKRDFSPDEAVYLIRTTAKALKAEHKIDCTPRELDHAIWKTQRGHNTVRNNHLGLQSKPQPQKPTIYYSNFNSEESFPFEQFWELLRSGGQVGDLEFSVNDDSQLCIRSANCAAHQQSSTAAYRIRRSTVRRYAIKTTDKIFRRDHGWFCQIFDAIAPKLN